MSAEPVFFDTNVIIYAYDRGDPVKQAVARHCMERELATGTAVLSTQVLGEFYQAGVIRKRALTAADADLALDALSQFTVQTADYLLVLAGIALHRKFGLSFWDGMILAAARRAGCRRVLSEDLNPGQDYDGVTVWNPFADAGVEH